MQRWIALFVIVALMAMPLGGLALAAPTQHSAELWHVSSIADPKTHKFSYCTVESGFDNGLYLAFARNRDLNTNIVVSFPDKRLEEKTKFRMLVAIDSYPVREMVGFSAATDTLVIPLQHDRKLIEWLQKGKLLDLKGPSDSAKFALDGAADALRQVQLCVENNLKAESANAGGKPEARPAVATGPLALNQPPAEDHMVEPLPLPATAPEGYAPTLAPSISAPASPPPQQMAAIEQPVAPVPAHSAPQAAPDSEQAIQQSDEQAARAEAARLAARRQKQQVAMAEASDTMRTETAQVADAQRQAKDDEVARATQTRLATPPVKPIPLAPAPVQQPRQVAEPQIVIVPEPAPASISPPPAPSPPRVTQPAVVSAPPVVAPAAVPQPPQPVATAMILDTPTETGPVTTVAVLPPAPTPPPIIQAATPPMAPPRQPLSPMVQPATLPASVPEAQSLPGVLQQAGLTPRSQGKTLDAYAWSAGGISGAAREVRAMKSFTDAMLDDLDGREKACRGGFSSTMEAPRQQGALSYSNVTTGCGASIGLVLYYQANDKFGVIAQETATGNRAEAETIRKRLSQVLQTNYR